MFRKLIALFSGENSQRISKNTGFLSTSIRKDVRGKKLIERAADTAAKKVKKEARWFFTSSTNYRFRKLLIILLILSIPLVFFSKWFLLISLHGVAAVSRIHYRWIRMSIGVELGIFVIVLTGISHGPVAGVTIGIMHFLVSRMITREPLEIVPICIVGYALVGFFAGVLPVTNILFFGMLMTLLYDLSTSPFFVIFLHYSVGREMLFIITHLLFNYWVFTTFGEWGLRLVGAI